MPVRLDHQLTGPDDAHVVILGGALGTTRDLWRAQVAALSGRFRVCALDHRGHGGSQAPPGPYSIDDLAGDVVGLLDDLGIERASYVGISLGGMVGLRLAEVAVDRIERLVVLCAAAVSPLGEQPWTDRAAQVRAGGTVAVVDALLERWFLPDFAEANPDRVDEIRQQVLGTSAEGYAGCCEAVGGMDLRDGLGAVTASTLLVAADSDQSIPAEHVLRVAQAIPGARFEVIEHAAHLVPVTHPDQVGQLLLDHLAG